jgi:hypothetical protein
MEAQGFVSKNDQVEKADRKKGVALSAEVRRRRGQIRYYNTAIRWL